MNTETTEEGLPIMEQKDLLPGMTVLWKGDGICRILVMKIPHNLLRIPGWHLGTEGDFTPNTRNNKWLAVHLPLTGDWPILLEPFCPDLRFTAKSTEVWDQKGNQIL